MCIRDSSCTAGSELQCGSALLVSRCILNINLFKENSGESIYIQVRCILDFKNTIPTTESNETEWWGWLYDSFPEQSCFFELNWTRYSATMPLPTRKPWCKLFWTRIWQQLQQPPWPKTIHFAHKSPVVLLMHSLFPLPLLTLSLPAVHAKLSINLETSSAEPHCSSEPAVQECYTADLYLSTLNSPIFWITHSILFIFTSI